MRPIQITILAVMGAAALVSGLAGQQAQWRPIPMVRDREGHAMVTDPLRKRVVLFGGIYRNDDILGDTWEWDGTAWVSFQPPVSPPPRFGHGMAFDPLRNTVLLFGGVSDVQANSYTVLDDTWEWDGQTWTQLFPAQSPSGRLTQMATDYRNGKVVLFGGGTWPLAALFPVPDDETWEWDGTTWTQRFPATVPAARTHAAMDVDPTSGMVAMFGGFAPFELQERTLWLWSGSDWIARNAAVAPSERGAATMVADAARSVLLLHGGNGSGPVKDDTWIWSGSTWTEAQPATVPPTRISPKLAYDAVRKEPILFGGPAVPVGELRRDTWSWDGTDWTKVDDAVLPHGFPLGSAHDTAHDELVVVANPPNGPTPLETWVLRGHDWAKLSPPTGLPAFTRFPMAYHAAAGVVVLLGSVPNFPSAAKETWLWDGTTWTRDVRSQLPPESWNAMVYDSTRKKVMLMAFSSGACQEWDASGWSQASWANAPTPRSAPAVAYDASRQRLVLFGGSSSVWLDDTWEFDGTRWTQRFPSNQPPPRDGAQMVYDPHLGGCVLLGGYPTYGAFHDTWLWDGQDWQQLNVGAVPGTRGWYPLDADYDASRQRVVVIYPNNYPALELYDETLSSPQPYPRLGQTLQLDLQMPNETLRPFVVALSDMNRPGIPLHSVPGVGVELVPLGPGPVLSASLAAGMAGVLDGSGRSSYRIPVPNDPSLLWRRLYGAGVVADRSWQARITNGIETRIVP